jgi:hypothetical protein
MATKEEIRAAVDTMAAVAEAIRELGSVPSGHLYARLMGHMSLETYEKIVGTLKGAGLVKEESHLLTWVAS